jgi:hypothetical protein
MLKTMCWLKSLFSSQSAKELILTIIIRRDNNEDEKNTQEK